MNYLSFVLSGRVLSDKQTNKSDDSFVMMRLKSEQQKWEENFNVLKTSSVLIWILCKFLLTCILRRGSDPWRGECLCD